VEFYSAIKKNEIMSLAEKWMELEIMLSEISPSHKDKSCMFSLMCRSQGKTKQNKTEQKTQGYEGKRGTIREVGEEKKRRREEEG
jgi:hypothetical protein